MAVIFEIFENKRIGIHDLESMSEQINRCTDGIVLRSVEFGLVEWAVWLGNTRSIEEPPARESRVPDRDFIN